MSKVVRNGCVVARLIALSEDGSADESVTPLPVYKGKNIYGRDDCHRFTQMISRKHIRLEAWTGGMEDRFDMYVEGPNPVIVTHLDEKIKVKTRECCSVNDSDIIHFLPNAFAFRLELARVEDPEDRTTEVVTPPLLEVDKVVRLVSATHSEGIVLLGKRRRQLLDDEALARRLQEEENEKGIDIESVHLTAESCSQSGSNCSLSKLHKTGSSSNFSPSSFHLLHTMGLPQSANIGCVSIQDVVEGDVQFAILSNYMVDISWLLSVCPIFSDIPVVMIHGERDESLSDLQSEKPSNWVLYRPPLPQFGTHHTKAMLLVYRTGVRVVVHTANLIYGDWNNKTQGLWMQDFPWKSSERNRTSPIVRRAPSEFEEDLVEYLTHLKWGGHSTTIPAFGCIKIDAQFFRMFDYSAATVRLVASVPGFHRGETVHKFGHMKLRSVLAREQFDIEFEGSPLVYQFSSLGSVDPKWIGEITQSMSSGLSTRGSSLGLGEVQLVWPTVEDIRCSLEGYAAGGSVPGPLKNMKTFLAKYWAKWRADHVGRGRAMPHIKTYVRYNGQSIAWFLLSSSNLSKAAWGTLQKDDSQLMIRSYELGVLFLPSSVLKASGETFSCTGNSHGSENKPGRFSSENQDSGEGSGLQAKLVTTRWEESNPFSSKPIVRLPVPYTLQPPRYERGDVPWAVDRHCTKPDVYGQVWKPSGI